MIERNWQLVKDDFSRSEGNSQWVLFTRTELDRTQDGSQLEGEACAAFAPKAAGR
jgi:hypothetical protein